MKNKYIDFQDSIPSNIAGAKIIDKFNLSSSMTNDGIHPTPSGQKIIANRLLET
jgi:lysophospholipase L1-like esterase